MRKAHRWTIALALLASTLALSGCLGVAGEDPGGDPSRAASEPQEDSETSPQEDPDPTPQDDAEASPQHDSETTFAWELRDCRIAAAMISVDAEALEPRVPDGFELVPPGEGFLNVSDPTGRAVLGVDAASCKRGAGPSGSQTDAVFGGLLAFVDPPEHLKQDGNNTLYLMRWDTAVPDPTIRENLTKLGVPAYDGDLDWAEYHNPAGDVVVGGGDLVLDDGLVFHPGGAGPISGPEEARDFTCVSFQETEDGELVTTRMEFKASVEGMGAGVLQVPSDHWSSDLVHDAPGSSGVYLAGQLDFEDGSVTLPS